MNITINELQYAVLIALAVYIVIKVIYFYFMKKSLSGPLSKPKNKGITKKRNK